MGINLTYVHFIAFMEEFRPLQFKHYLIFKVANEKFAMDILDIESIHTSRRKSAFDDIEDSRIAVRRFKRLVPIINLRKQLRLFSNDHTNPSLLFIKCKEENIAPIIGLQVDEIIEIIETVVPQKPDGKRTRLIKAMVGTYDEVVMVLRVKDVVSDDKPVDVSNPVLN